MIKEKTRMAVASKFQRRDVPFCPEHDAVMKAYMTRGRITYYACQCKSCRFRSKVIATVVVLNAAS